MSDNIPQRPEGAPPAAGVRLQWRDLPVSVRAAVEHWMGSGIMTAATQVSGFSPGAAARLQTADGRRVFVKAVGPEPNPVAPGVHRREACVVPMLPAAAPVPRLLWTYDEGDDGWVVLVFEDIEGWHPHEPWREDELARVLETLRQLTRVLTPTPVSLESASARFERDICGWRWLQKERPAQLDEWSCRYLEALAALEAAAAEAVAGDTLLHLDVRADNLLLTPERVFVVDWPHACVGAAWVDLVCFAPSVRMQGGPPPEVLLARYLAGQDVNPDAITAAIAAVAGFFTSRALQPPPPGLPTLRSFQAAQGAVARRWVAQRTGWE
jgi:aminoglycoside phosphotransferase (APT) family kinase protein